MKLLEVVDNGPRNWWFRSGDVLDSGGTLTFDRIKILGQNRRSRGFDRNAIVTVCHITLYYFWLHISGVGLWDYASESTEGKCVVLTQVPGHQVGIVEILHAQSNDVDEFLNDLHELHGPRIDLHKGKQERAKTLLMSHILRNTQNKWKLRNFNQWKLLDRCLCSMGFKFIYHTRL